MILIANITVKRYKRLKAGKQYLWILITTYYLLSKIALDDDNTSPMDGGGPSMTFPVKFSGARPGISDFLSAILSQEDTGEALANVNKNWLLRRQSRQQEEGASFIVDERNGFIRFDHRYADAGEAAYTEFCYWNCNDGKHKLVCANTGLLVNGKATDCQYCGLFFYLYDNEKRTLTYTSPYDVGASIQVTPAVSYSLPRQGKDIRAYIHDSRGVVNILMKWNGQKFDQEQVK